MVVARIRGESTCNDFLESFDVVLTDMADQVDIVASYLERGGLVVVSTLQCLVSFSRVAARTQ